MKPDEMYALASWYPHAQKWGYPKTTAFERRVHSMQEYHAITTVTDIVFRNITNAHHQNTVFPETDIWAKVKQLKSIRKGQMDQLRSEKVANLLDEYLDIDSTFSEIGKYEESHIEPQSPEFQVFMYAAMLISYLASEEDEDTIKSVLDRMIALY